MPSFVAENLQRLEGPERTQRDELYKSNLKDIAASFSIAGIDTVRLFNNTDVLGC